MELNEQDKERIIAEEKLRMETRKEFFKDNFGRGGWGHFRGGSYAYGCHGGHRFGFLKGLLLAAVIFGVFHLCHRNYCGWGPGYYAPYPMQPQAAPAPQAPAKN